MVGNAKDDFQRRIEFELRNLFKQSATEAMARYAAYGLAKNRVAQPCLAGLDVE